MASASTTSPAAAWTLDTPPSPRPAGEQSARPAGSSSGPFDESIIGIDNRVLVDPRDVADGGKYRSIVKIFSCFNDGNSGEKAWLMGTGWLASPDALITSGDVVFDWASNMGAAIQVKCYIGYNGREYIQHPSVQYRHGKLVVLPWQWTQSTNNRVHNVAVIRLWRPFDGNLRPFNFTTTPASGSYLLGVVGYPGDMSTRSGPEPERGAQMYEMFENTMYDLSKSADHMLEYRVSTYKGQSGAPVINRHNFNVFGVHNYSRGNTNSGTPIGGQYGIDFNALISHFSNSSNFGAPGVILPINVDSSGGVQPKPPTPSPGPDGNSSDPTKPNPLPPAPDPAPLTPDPATGSFLEALRVVTGIGKDDQPILSPLQGPVKQAASVILGTLLNTIASSKTLVNGATEFDGAPERSSLAEASLQAVVSAEQLRQADQTLAKMEKIWESSAISETTIDKLAKLLLPIVINGALEIATNEWAEATGGRRQVFGVDGPKVQQTGGLASTGNLPGPPPAPVGDSTPSNLIAKILEDSASTANPIASEGAKKVIEDATQKLMDKASIGSGPTLFSFTSNEEAIKLLLKRAHMADIALQVLLSLRQDTLDGITVFTPAENSGEAQSKKVTDFITTTTLKIGPTTVDSAKNAAKRLTPVLMEVLTSKPPAVIDVLKGLKPHS